MSPIVPLTDLKNKHDTLLREKENLLRMLKEKYPEIYKLMTEHGIDLSDLSQYSASLALAAAVSLSTLQNMSTHLPADTNNAVVFEEPKVIQPEEFKGLSNEQKAKLVRERYGYLIERAAKKYTLDPDLIFATIMLESGGNTYALRSEPSINDASYGLGQILYGTARGLGFKGTPQDLYDPAVNIDLIALYHRRNLNVYGDLTNEQLTIAYNTGNPYSTPYPGHVTKFNNWISYVSNLVI